MNFPISDEGYLAIFKRANAIENEGIGKSLPIPRVKRFGTSFHYPVEYHESTVLAI